MSADNPDPIPAEERLDDRPTPSPRPGGSPGEEAASPQFEGHANPTTRFTDRVANYVRYRPGYPAEIIPYLSEAIGLGPADIVADVGAGTGISTRLFLDHGNVVFAVEPNAAMRAAAEAELARYPNFRSIAARAEATGLAQASVDLVAAAQAFHWFDRPAARAEFARILRPGGWVVLLWNVKLTDATPFLRDYEALLVEFGTDYTAVRHENVTDTELAAFFGQGYSSRTFPNAQRLDYAGLEGRLLSASYAPGPEHPDHAPMLAALRRIFDARQVGGQVVLEYETRVYSGRP